MVIVNARFLTQPITGVQRFAAEISRELLEIRNDVVLVAPRGDLTDRRFESSDVRQVGRLSGHGWEQVSLPRYARRRKDLIVSLTSTGPIRYRPQISTHHDITYIRHPESFSSKFRALYGFVVPRTIAHSAELITVSEFSRNELSSHFGIAPERFTVVSNGADSRFAPSDSPSSDDRRRYFLAVSSPNSHKNFGRMIAAFTRFSKLHPDVELLVVGTQAASFSRQTYDASNAPITFLGRVDDAALADLYRGALAFVFPSLYEGFGIPPLEAQQCGCPVIAADAASMPEVLGDSALYVDPLSEAEIEAGMVRVAEDRGLRERLVVAGLANSRRFSWRRSAERVSELIDRVQSRS